MALTITLGELSGILLILQTALLVRIADAVIVRHAAPASLLLLFAGFLATVPLRLLSQWGSRRAGWECSSIVKRIVRSEVGLHLASLGPIALSGLRTGEIVTVAVDAVEALEGYYARYLPQRALSTLLPFTVLAVVFPLDWISGLVLVLTAAFLPVSMIVIGEESHVRNQRLWSTLARMSGRFLDILQGLTTVKIFGAVRREAAEIERSSGEYRAATMSVLRIAFLSSFMLELLSAVSIAIVAILSGLRLMAATMHFAPAYFILLVAPEYFLVLRTLGTFYHMRMEAMAAAERITGLLSAAAPARPAQVVTSPASPTRTREACSVTFDSVSFSFAARKILDGVSFSVPAGGHVALAGASGAGKSTILNILLGFLDPVEGRVLVDGIPLSRFDRPGWLSRIAWLPQNPTFFHGTIRANIRLGRTDASDREIEDAARMACVDEFLHRLPAGLDTVVGEGGKGLSVGQVQRVAMARLFLRRPALLLLDEPTAHLDQANAELVSAGIEALARDRTMIMVTHRDAGRMERMLVLESGRVGEGP